MAGQGDSLRSPSTLRSHRTLSWLVSGHPSLRAIDRRGDQGRDCRHLQHLGLSDTHSLTRKPTSYRPVTYEIDVHSFRTGCSVPVAFPFPLRSRLRSRSGRGRVPGRVPRSLFGERGDGSGQPRRRMPIPATERRCRPPEPGPHQLLAVSLTVPLLGWVSGPPSIAYRPLSWHA